MSRRPDGYAIGLDFALATQRVAKGESHLQRKRTPRSATWVIQVWNGRLVFREWGLLAERIV